MKNKYQKQGIVTLIYVLSIALVASFVLAIGGSRVLLSIARNRSAADNIAASYASESYINNILRKSSQGTLSSADFGEKTIGDITYLVKDEGGSPQTISVSARKGFAVSKIQAIQSNTSTRPSVEIMLSMDCTSSMDQPANDANPSGPTRFDAQEDAAINFVNQIAKPEYQNQAEFKVGVAVYGVDGQRLIAPTNSYSSVITAVRDGFSSKKNLSSACARIIDSTSVGTGYTLAYDYFNDNDSNGAKRVVVVITDGVSNSRIPYPDCPPVAPRGYESSFPNTTAPLSGFCPAYPKNESGSLNYCKPNG